MNTQRTSALAVAALAITVAATTAPVSASTVAARSDSHCVVETARQEGTAELQVRHLSCFEHFDDVLGILDAPQEMIDRVDHPSELTDADMEVLGPDGTTTSSDSTTSDATMAASSTFTIGVHYDGPSFTGDSFSVSGSDCAGGYLNVSSTWNNRVTSTLNGCPSIVHYDGYNMVGTTQTTTGSGGTLTYMDNRTSSIRYRS